MQEKRFFLFSFKVFSLPKKREEKEHETRLKVQPSSLSFFSQTLENTAFIATSIKENALKDKERKKRKRGESENENLL